MTLFLIIVAIVIIGVVAWYLMTGKPKGPIVPKADAGLIIPPPSPTPPTPPTPLYQPPPPPPPLPPPETPGM
jgi:hypothetical protein